MRRTIVLVFVSVLICQVSITVVEAGSFTYVNSGCQNTGQNYTVGSVYNDNLNSLFNNLTIQSASAKFYNSTEGDGLDKVYGLFQCREDVDPALCSACVIDATQKIVAECPLQGEAIVWYYECMLRYANRNIFALQETDPPAYFWSQEGVADYVDFSTKLAAAIKDNIKTASFRSPHFASKETKLESSDTLYSFAQCTPDIDALACSACLTEAKNGMVENGDGKIYVAVMFPSCQMRYNTTAPILFNQSPTHSSPSKQTSTTSNKKAIQAGVIAAIVVSAAVGLLLLVALLWTCLYRKKHKELSGAEPTELSREMYDNGVTSDIESLGDLEFQQYDFATLQKATRNFSAENKLGEGGFGTVYKGTLDNGEQLAVKRLSDTSRLGTREFMTEARFMAKHQHKNLVRLVGFSFDGVERLLAYEFLPNLSLDRFLFDPKKRPLLDWGKRYKIVMGIARGLEYLHEDCKPAIIHRDLKPGNVLLDRQMNPKIDDFGMVRLVDSEQRHGDTNSVIGTFGYMAPEYITTGIYSDKSDVYSFGIMVLEIVSGQRNRKMYPSPRKEDLPVHVWRLWNEGRSFDITDPALYNNCSSTDVIRCIQIGLLCVQVDAEKRPTMSSVVQMLNGSMDLSLPSAPTTSSHQLSMMNTNSGENEIDSSSAKTVTWRTELDQDLYPKPR